MEGIMRFKKVLGVLLASTMVISSTVIANAYEQKNDGFVSGSEISMNLVGRYTSGQVNFDGGVMEIISYNYANGYAYAVNGVSGQIAIIDINQIVGTSYTELNGRSFNVKNAVASKDSSFLYGDMTSIATSPDNTKLAVALQASEHNQTGRVAIFDVADDGILTISDVITVGIQPDMVTFSDNNTVLTADEAEPRVINGSYDDPEGSVSIVDLESKTATVVGFEKFDDSTVRANLINQGVMFKKDADASKDFEPEYITVVGRTAYVSLQEANAIAVVDIEAKEISDVYGLGFIDLGTVAFDINDNDEEYSSKTHPGVYGVRMPDAIDSYEVNGTTYIVTANEGDGREYGDEDEAGFYCNETKIKFSKESSPNGNMTEAEYGPDGLDYGKVLFIDPETIDALNDDSYDYMYGGRGFTIFEVTGSGLKVAYEVGNEIEAKTAELLPADYFNCSNDNNKTEDRSGKKGAEVESVKIGRVDGKTYAFVALERVSGIMVYNISNPSSPTFVNYLNSRDFDEVIGNPANEVVDTEDNDPSQDGVFDYEFEDGVWELDHYITKGDIAPEGLAFVPAEKSPNGYPMLLTSNEVSGTVTAIKLGDTQYVAPTEEIVILHTNDTHCDIENGFGFAGVASYKNDMEDYLGEENVTLIDAGDAVQGGAVGKLTNGEAIIELMNEVGYDIMTLGNHEFDYQVPQMKKLMDMFNGTTVSSNFVDLSTGLSVFDSYEMVDYGSFQVAYVGITTPETYTKSTPAYFQDENGNFIYGFCEGDNGNNLYKNVQSSVDKAVAGGADYIIAVAHLGVDDSSAPYTSTDVIKNTIGIDILIDGHSHSEVGGQEVTNKKGEVVIVNQTGDKFNNLGKITINDKDKTIKAELISSEDYTEKDADVQSAVDKINEEQAGLLEQVVATIDTTLVVNDPNTGNRLIRSAETNLGDFCADAYRYVLGTDIAIVNGGGIRADIEKGEVTYADIIAVHPWGNNATSVEASGQAILDALEMGASAYPDENGGFLQVSGLTYTIDTSVESSVVKNDMGSFVKVDGEYRVKNVMVGGVALDLNKMYTVGSHDYLLLSGGDGMTMFQNAKVIKDMYAVDNEVLMTYMKEVGVSSSYGDIHGQTRISIVDGVDTDIDTDIESDNPDTGDSNKAVTEASVVMLLSIALLVIIRRKTFVK